MTNPTTLINVAGTALSGAGRQGFVAVVVTVIVVVVIVLAITAVGTDGY